MALGSVDSAPRSEADFESLFAAQLAELKALDESSQRNQSEIDRLKRETAQLNCEGQALEAETRAILARVKLLLS